MIEIIFPFTMVFVLLCLYTQTLKQFIAIILLSGILLQSFNKVIVLLNYEINREYIAQNLCENKDKPKMHCEGKCHLQKQLEKEEKKEQAPSQNLKDKSEVQLFCQKELVFNLPELNFSEQLFSPYQFSKTTSSSFSIFHPPKC